MAEPAAGVPVAVLFNEARTLAQVRQALDGGCNAVMLDTSELPYAENVALTRQIVAMAHSLDASVEAEFGPGRRAPSRQAGQRSPILPPQPPLSQTPAWMRWPSQSATHTWSPPARWRSTLICWRRSTRRCLRPW